METMTRWATGPEIKAGIHALLTHHDVTVPEVAEDTGLSDSTLYRRIKKPDTFTAGELRKLCDYFKIPESVLLGGRFTVLRWLAEHGPEDGPGLGITPSGWNVRSVDFSARQSQPLHVSAVAA